MSSLLVGVPLNERDIAKKNWSTFCWSSNTTFSSTTRNSSAQREGDYYYYSSYECLRFEHSTRYDIQLWLAWFHINIISIICKGVYYVGYAWILESLYENSRLYKNDMKFIYQWLPSRAECPIYYVRRKIVQDGMTMKEKTRGAQQKKND